MPGDNLTPDEDDSLTMALLEGLDRNGFREAVLAELDPATRAAVLAAEDRGVRAAEFNGYNRRAKRRV